MTFSPQDFASSFKDFMDNMNSQAVEEVPIFFRRLSEHFGQDPTTLPLVSEEFPPYEHANLHIALTDYCADDGRTATTHGFQSEMRGYHSPSLSELVSRTPSKYGTSPAPGPLQYVNVRLHDDNTIACVQLGLFLIEEGDSRLAVLIRPADGYGKASFVLEAMAPEQAEAEKFLARMRSAIAKKNIYRNHVLSIDVQQHEGMSIQFHTLPSVSRDEIILPEGLLHRIDRQTIGFGKFSEALLEAGRHLKRGLLLYGPPGTGKTLTAMYLASQMPDRTVLLLVGRSLGLIEQTCALARVLQPAMIVLEDVDLVAEERTRQQGCATPILFELLNEMDGLAKDMDVIFLLTTNRADILEPALAARPGRIDQAFEIPLPDAECRRRLFELYAKGLTMEVQDTDTFIKKTEGASAAFICEMMRKAALFSAEDGLPIVVKDTHLDQALRELAISGGALTRSLLGFRGNAD